MGGRLDNWAICDTACLRLFVRTPFAWEKARQWSTSPREFVKRAAFVLMASLAGHDKTASDAPFLGLLPLIEHGAHDERNLVKKGVNWALRRIGTRNLTLNAAALAVTKRLSQSEDPACRWVGKDALRELTSPKVPPGLARREPVGDRRIPRSNPPLARGALTRCNWRSLLSCSGGL